MRVSIPFPHNMLLFANGKKENSGNRNLFYKSGGALREIKVNATDLTGDEYSEIYPVCDGMMLL